MIIIGAHQRDVQGSARLEKLLVYLKPKSVAVGWYSDDSLFDFNPSLEGDLHLIDGWVADARNRLSQSDLPESVKQYFTEVAECGGYDLRVAARLQEKIGYQLFLVEHPSIRDIRKRGILQTYHAPMTQPKEKLDVLGKHSVDDLLRRFQQMVDDSYTNQTAYSSVARFFGEAGEEANDFLQKMNGKISLVEALDERMRYLESKIRELSPDVCIGTIFQTYGFDPELEGPILGRPLVPRIKDMKPETMMLIEADKLVINF